MNLSRALKQAEKFTVDNSPMILTAVGVVGTVATAVLTGKAVLKADKIVKLEEANRANKAQLDGSLIQQELTNKEKFKLTWVCYAPPIGMGVATIACIIGANRIESKRAAALAAAYAISEKSLTEYKDKVVDHIGKNKEQKIRDEIAQEHVTRNPPSKNEIFITGGGDVLCYDKYTGRYFMSSVDALKKAENEVNFYVLHNDYATLNDFYRYVGLDPVPVGEEVGWVCDLNFELIFSTTISDNDKPCIVIEYQVCGVRKRPESTLRSLDVKDRVITR